MKPLSQCSTLTPFDMAMNMRPRAEVPRLLHRDLPRGARRGVGGSGTRPATGGGAEARERAFICTASHDFVTPLMAVTANCDVLEAEASDQAGLASWVANIRAAADEMATHIADMLMHMGGD